MTTSLFRSCCRRSCRMWIFSLTYVAVSLCTTTRLSPSCRLTPCCGTHARSFGQVATSLAPPLMPMSWCKDRRACTHTHTHTKSKWSESSYLNLTTGLMTALWPNWKKTHEFQDLVPGFWKRCFASLTFNYGTLSKEWMSHLHFIYENNS